LCRNSKSLRQQRYRSYSSGQSKIDTANDPPRQWIIADNTTSSLSLQARAPLRTACCIRIIPRGARAKVRDSRAVSPCARPQASKLACAVAVHSSGPSCFLISRAMSYSGACSLATFGIKR